MAKAKVELDVDGMTCQGCVRTVETTLESMPGVFYAHVNLGAQKAVVEFDDEMQQIPALIAAVRQAGFAAAQN